MNKYPIPTFTCPFCGNLPEIYPENPAKEGNAWGQVTCINSECSVKPCVSDGEPISDDRGSDEYKKSAIRKWNNRS